MFVSLTFNIESVHSHLLASHKAGVQAALLCATSRDSQNWISSPLSVALAHFNFRIIGRVYV